MVAAGAPTGEDNGKERDGAAGADDVREEATPEHRGLQRGLEILAVLGSPEALERGGLGVVRIAQLVGREKTQVSRGLKTLAAAGFAERDPETRSYRLGWKIFALGAGAGDARLLHAAVPVLQDLVAGIGETAHLSVLDGVEVLTLLSELPAVAVRASGWQGRRVPASCTSSGRALLFDHSLEDLQRRFVGREMLRSGPNAARSLHELHDRIVRDRAHGVAVSDEEFEAGLVAVAAPVRNARGAIVAVVNVSAPKFRLGSALEVAGNRVLAAATSLSSALGNRSDLSVAAR